MEALVERTAKLPPVEIVVPENVVGRSTTESIQAGLYYSHYFAIREMLLAIRRQEFANEPVLCIGTGGFSRLFEKAGLFDDIQADLVLQGLYQTCKLNRGRPTSKRS